MRRWGIIFGSRTRSAQRRWALMREYLEQQSIPYDMVQSEGEGAVERLAGMLCQNGYKTIVLVGSDGSLNDAINGIFSVPKLPKDLALGIIPLGIGNDFAAFWDITTENYRDAIDRIRQRRTKPIDLGVCAATDANGNTVSRYFLNCVNIGLGARLIELTNRWQRLISSKRLSLIPIYISQIFERKSFNVEFGTETEHISQQVMSVCVGNAKGYGQTPNAVPYNGLLDMSVITRPDWWRLFEGFWLLGKGQFLNYRNVHPYRVNHIHFDDIGHASVSLDGRMLRAKHIRQLDISLLPEHLQFIF